MAAARVDIPSQALPSQSREITVIDAPADLRALDELMV